MSGRYVQDIETSAVSELRSNRIHGVFCCDEIHLFFPEVELSDQKFDCMELRGTYYLEFTKRV